MVHRRLYEVSDRVVVTNIVVRADDAVPVLKPGMLQKLLLILVLITSSRGVAMPAISYVLSSL